MQNFVNFGQALLEISQFFDFQDGGRPPCCIFIFKIFSSHLGWEAQCASPCQISSKSVKRLPRYRVNLFKMASIRHLGFLKFGFLTCEFFNSHWGPEDKCTSSWKISSKSVKWFWRYHDFSIFKMAAVRHLGFVGRILGPPSKSSTWRFLSLFGLVWGREQNFGSQKKRANYES